MSSDRLCQLLLVVAIACGLCVAFDRYVEVREKQKKAEQTDRMLDIAESLVR
jgi:hypothetical protein